MTGYISTRYIANPVGWNTTSAPTASDRVIHSIRQPLASTWCRSLRIAAFTAMFVVVLLPGACWFEKWSLMRVADPMKNNAVNAKTIVVAIAEV